MITINLQTGFYVKLYSTENLIKSTRNSWILNCPTGPNQPKSQIMMFLNEPTVGTRTKMTLSAVVFTRGSCIHIHLLHTYATFICCIFVVYLFIVYSWSGGGKYQQLPIEGTNKDVRGFETTLVGKVSKFRSIFFSFLFLPKTSLSVEIRLRKYTSKPIFN